MRLRRRRESNLNVRYPKIPKPRKVSVVLKPSDDPSCFAAQMKLRGSLEQRNVYYELVGGIAKLHDKYNGDIVGSTSPRWQEFLDAALSMYPILDTYQDAWPAAAIVRIHRKRLASHRNGKGLAEWTKYMISSDQTDRDSNQRGRRGPPPSTGGVSVDGSASVASGFTESQWASERSTSSAETSSQHPVHTPRLARSITNELIARAQLKPNPSNGTRTSQDPSTLPSPYALERERGSDYTSFSRLRESLVVSPQNEAILGFLRALTPDLSHLLPIFVDMGVVDDAALQGLARMGSRDQWVYSWVKENLITELEFSAIAAGFKKIHYIPPVSTQLSAGRSM